MGSKSPEHERIPHGGHTSDTGSSVAAVGGEPRGTHLSRDGDSSLGDGGGGDDDGDDDDEGVDGAATVSLTPATASKKKKSKKSKSKSKSKKKSAKQSSPPRVPLEKLFSSGEYPRGEIQDNAGPVENTARTTAEESRYLARAHLRDTEFVSNYRRAAEIHRQVRGWVQDTVRPGQGLTDIAVGIEDGVRALLDNSGLEVGQGLVSGMGFPTGLALNNCVAHYTPNPGQKEIVLQRSDVMKVDFGVHIHGWILDSAFTVSFDPMYDPLLAAVKDATNTGIKNAGVDVRISDISAAIQETMESYEVQIGQKIFPVKPVRNLSGHNISRYQIHGGKSIPFTKNKDQTKMEEGEVFALETFGSTGRGYIIDGPGVYGYGKDIDAPKTISSSLASAKSLYKTINENFGTIVFCRRYLERLGVQRYLAGMNQLASKGVVEVYTPLMDIEGSYSAQFEHTFLLGESSKEILSRGDDY